MHLARSISQKLLKRGSARPDPYEETAQRLMEHAKLKYNEGWDFLVETSTLEELQLELKELAGKDPDNLFDCAVSHYSVIADFRRERCLANSECSQTRF